MLGSSSLEFQFHSIYVQPSAEQASQCSSFFTNAMFVVRAPSLFCFALMIPTGPEKGG